MSYPSLKPPSEKCSAPTPGQFIEMLEIERRKLCHKDNPELLWSFEWLALVETDRRLRELGI
jgi:hypothetical protein